jgi:hypothetical protein
MPPPTVSGTNTRSLAACSTCSSSSSSSVTAKTTQRLQMMRCARCMGMSAWRFVGRQALWLTLKTAVHTCKPATEQLSSEQPVAASLSCQPTVSMGNRCFSLLCKDVCVLHSIRHHQTATGVCALTLLPPRTQHGQVLQWAVPESAVYTCKHATEQTS